MQLDQSAPGQACAGGELLQPYVAEQRPRPLLGPQLRVRPGEEVTGGAPAAVSGPGARPEHLGVGPGEHRARRDAEFSVEASPKPGKDIQGRGLLAAQLHNVSGAAGRAWWSWLREAMPSLVKTLCRWYLTVRGLMKSRAPISGLDRPSLASRATWASWAVNG